jgi:signal transduction histidine kinase
MRVNDAVISALASGGGSLAVAVPGLAGLWLLRRRRLTELIPLTVVVAALAVSGGLIGAALYMGGHTGRAEVLAPALGTAAVVSLAGGLLLASWVRASGRALAHLLSTGDGSVDGPQELRRLGAQLTLAHTRTTALEASRREWVTWVSHDLRTPLAGLRAMAEALEDGVVNDRPTVERYHATMRREVERLATMVDDLFELSRLQAGSPSAQQDLVDLADLVADALASADPLARQRQVHVVGPRVQPPAVGVGATDMGRVLRNLLVNAIRHTPHDGTVLVDTTLEADAVAIAIQDACGGIPAADLPRVFETSFRGSVSRTADVDGGAGLGLAIARGLVHAHHGQITVINSGGGCRFEVRLPLDSSAGMPTGTP